jgi:hypothetical protein
MAPGNRDLAYGPGADDKIRHEPTCVTRKRIGLQQRLWISTAILNWHSAEVEESIRRANSARIPIVRRSSSPLHSRHPRRRDGTPERRRGRPRAGGLSAGRAKKSAQRSLVRRRETGVSALSRIRPVLRGGRAPWPVTLPGLAPWADCGSAAAIGRSRRRPRVEGYYSNGEFASSFQECRICPWAQPPEAAVSPTQAKPSEPTTFFRSSFARTTGLVRSST